MVLLLFAICEFCEFRKSQCFHFNVEC